MKDYTTYEGAHPSIKINILKKLPATRLLLALKRIRDGIANGRKLVYYDDTTPGNKSMSCSWGLCHESKATWPDAQDHTFPVDFEISGRLSPLDTAKEHLCPMDRREKHDGNGCFYTCRIFQARKKRPRPTQHEALALYGKAIEQLEASLNPNESPTPTA
jgi:hypothetical protein